jgi:G3E family GTPase
MFTNEAFALLDWIVIETTGLADPAPLIQSFYMDSECQKRMRLDCVLTVVDSKHLPIHLAQHQYEEVRRKSGLPTSSDGGSGSGGSGGSGAHGGVPEAVLQISFADKVVLNKTDLVTPRDVQKLTQQIGELNPYAAVMACQYGHVDIRELLNVKAFDPKRFTSTWTAQHKDGASFDRPILIQRDAQGKILKKQVRVDFSGRFHDASAAAATATATATTTKAQQVKRDAQQIRTVSLITDEAIDFDAFNVWVSQVLQAQGPNIYRLKGILHMHGYDEQFVCHGVHMIFEGDRAARWPVDADGGAQRRRSRLVVIGKELDQAEWEAGFASTFHVHSR